MTFQFQLVVASVEYSEFDHTWIISPMVFLPHDIIPSTRLPPRLATLDNEPIHLKELTDDSLPLFLRQRPSQRHLK